MTKAKEGYIEWKKNQPALRRFNPGIYLGDRYIRELESIKIQFIEFLKSQLILGCDKDENLLMIERLLND